MIGPPVLITPPSALPISIDDARTYLRIDAGDLDIEVQLQLKAAIGEVERVTATRLAAQTIELSADRFAELEHLPIGPVSAIVALRYIAADGTTITLASDQYELFGAGLARGIRPAFGKAWPAAAVRGAAVTVRLDVGYGEAVPDTVTIAVLEAVRSLSDGAMPDVSGWLVNDRIWG